MYITIKNLLLFLVTLENERIHINFNSIDYYNSKLNSNFYKQEHLSRYCKNFNIQYSRPDAKASIQEYYEEENMVAISDIDTRALVRHIRDKGAMNGIISSQTTDIDELKKQLAEVPSMEGLQLCSKVSTKEAYFYGDENASLKVAVLDLGVKKNILRCLSDRG